MKIGFLGAKVLAQFGVFDEDGDMTELKNAEGQIKKLRKQDMLGLLDELQQVRIDLEIGKISAPPEQERVQDEPTQS